MFFTIPAPNNNPYCRHSVIPVTKPLDNYIFKIGKTKDGKKIFELDKNKILSEEDNYCPFLTEIGRCNIYKQRPKVCRDFGKKGWFDCEQKISLKELISYKVKEFIDALKYTFKSNK